MLYVCYVCKDCALCDVALDDDGNIIVVDRDNRKVKVSDHGGHLAQTKQQLKISVQISVSNALKLAESNGSLPPGL